MTLDEAASVIAQVCNQWTGTIAQGEVVKQAYQLLVAAAGADPAAVEAAAGPDKPATPNRAARRAKGPTKKAGQTRARRPAKP